MSPTNLGRRAALRRLGGLTLAAAAGTLTAGTGRTGEEKPAGDKPARPGPKEAREIQSNLKQIVLALHNMNDTYGSLPPAVICDPNGKPLFSWRVMMVPFIESNDMAGRNLFREFKTDEPWDSPNNKKLITRMPSWLATPGDPAAAKGLTYFRVFAGKDAAFLPTATQKDWTGKAAGGHRIANDFPDGLSNTLFVAMGQEAVPWTKPDELVYDASKPLPKIGGPYKDGSYAAFADGSVRFLPASLSEKTLRALITRAGGETIDRKDLQPR